MRALIETLKNWYKDMFGTNEGIELIAKRLGNGAGSIMSYNINTEGLYEFIGTGKYLFGRGRNKTYDIQARVLYAKPYSRQTGLKPVVTVAGGDQISKALETLYNSPFTGLQTIQASHYPTEVIKFVSGISSRLKPYQGYPLGDFYITDSFYCKEGYTVLNGSFNKIVIPASMIGSYDLFSGVDLMDKFDPENIIVIDQDKIDRIHRKDTDLRRWFTVTKVDSITCKHVLAYTHRCTAGGKTAYYNVQFLIDSSAQGGKPFYTTELLKAAVATLAREYSSSEWGIEIYPENIQVKAYDHKPMSLIDYVTRQDTHPENRTHNPIVINDNPCVRPSFSYVTQQQTGYTIETLEQRTRHEQKAAEESRR